MNDTSLTWLGRLIESPTGNDWQRLMDVYAPLLKAWMTRAGVVDADRDDLVQEVLLVVVRRVGEFVHEHPGAFRGWLRAILANHLKKYFHENLLVSRIELDALTDPKSQISELLDREHDEFMVRRALQLAERDSRPQTWEAFRKHVVEGQDAKDVAAELNISLNAVIKAKCRILKRLRLELGDLCRL